MPRKALIEAGDAMADVLRAMDARAAPSWWDGVWLAELVQKWEQAKRG